MSEGSDALFVEIALDKGALTRAQVEECRADQTKLSELGYARSIAHIARKKRFISQSGVAAIRRDMRERGHLPSIGGYELIEKIGEGAMGAVYMAMQTSLNRVVALKVLPGALMRSPRFVKRFQREARLAARITHPNAVQVYDVGEKRGCHYIAMEYVEGADLAELISAGPIGEERALRIVRGIAEALRVAHEQGIVHRDVKPSNIMVAADGTPKLADLGLARQTGAPGATLTREGATVGTPEYMSPEQCAGAGNLDGRSDIYSLGATLFHMVCGRPPFKGETPMAVMLQHVNDPLPSPRDYAPGVSEGLLRLILRMMRKGRDDRFQTCEELIEAIRRVERGEVPAGRIETPHAPPPRELSRFRGASAMLAAGAVLVVGVTSALWMLVAPAGDQGTPEAGIPFGTRTPAPRRVEPAAPPPEKAADVKEAEGEAGASRRQYDAAVLTIELLIEQGEWRKARGELENLAQLASGAPDAPAERLRLAEQIRKGMAAATAKEAARKEELLLTSYKAKREQVEALARERKRPAALKAWAELEAIAAKLARKPEGHAALGERVAEAQEAIVVPHKPLPDPAEAAVRSALARVGSFTFMEVSLERAVARVSTACGVEIRFSDEAKLLRDSTVRTHLGKTTMAGALDRLLRPKGLAWQVSGGAVEIVLAAPRPAPEKPKPKPVAGKEASGRGAAGGPDKPAAGAKPKQPASKKAAFDFATPASWQRWTRRMRVVGPKGESRKRMAYYTNSIGMGLAPVPPGEFLMGSELLARGERRVRITKPFLIGMYEVTNEQYRRFKPFHNSGYSRPEDKEGSLNKKRQPAALVSWEDASAFCKWLSGKENVAYRLPTEAEWEYACRGGSEDDFPWGKRISSKRCNYKSGRGRGASREVGSFRANEFGLCDTIGNVAEWCSDWHSEEAPPADDPTGPATGLYRVVRGGGWADEAAACRAYSRKGSIPGAADYHVGFRVVCVPRLRERAANGKP